MTSVIPLQNWELKRLEVVDAFRRRISSQPSLRERRIPLAWSNWGFGLEPLEKSAARLRRSGVEWIELHGNRHGPDIGYRSGEVRAILDDHGIRVAGVCGAFTRENDLSSNSGYARQRAIDYIRRQVELCHEVGGTYCLVIPGAVGRPEPYDSSEFERSVESVRCAADAFVEAGVRGAVEPIRSAEVSLIHTLAEARRYIEAVDHPGLRHVNGDVYHMQVEEDYTAGKILEAEDLLVNIHLADSNRRALGLGSLDVDAIVMALYAIGFGADDLHFATAEPLGPGGDPYPAMFGRPDEKEMDLMVEQTVRYWREREDAVKALLD